MTILMVYDGRGPVAEAVIFTNGLVALRRLRGRDVELYESRAALAEAWVNFKIVSDRAGG